MIRAIRPDDRGRLLAAFRLLERESIYTRFFRPRNDVSGAELDRAVAVDFVREVALIVTTVVLAAIVLVAVSGGGLFHDGSSATDSLELSPSETIRKRLLESGLNP